MDAICRKTVPKCSHARIVGHIDATGQDVAAPSAFELGSGLFEHLDASSNDDDGRGTGEDEVACDGFADACAAACDEDGLARLAEKRVRGRYSWVRGFVDCPGEVCGHAVLEVEVGHCDGFELEDWYRSRSRTGYGDFILNRFRGGCDAWC